MPDDETEIKAAIKKWLKIGCEMIICTGGMSVDADDVTPTAIKNSGAKIVTYGSPILPGAMIVIAYNEDIPILGLPANIIFADVTAFDIVLPRILADELLNAKRYRCIWTWGTFYRLKPCHYLKVN